MRNLKRTMAVNRRVRGASIALAGVAMVLALASCGGGHDDGNPPPAPPPVSNEPPPSASQSVAGLIAYLTTLVATMLDTVEPLDLTNFTPQVSDTTEPDPSV